MASQIFPNNEEFCNYMAMGILSCIKGVENKHGGPFGCCIVKDNQIIAVGHNTVLKSDDPSCHAEMNCIRKACQQLNSYDLSGCTLYTTCEPCPMCWGATYSAHIKKMYMGATQFTAAKYGFDDQFFYEEFILPIEERVLKTNIDILKTEIIDFIKSTPSYKYNYLIGNKIIKSTYDHSKLYKNENKTKNARQISIPCSPVLPLSESDCEYFMRLCISNIKTKIDNNKIKEKDIYSTLIVDINNNIISYGYDTTKTTNDITCTSVINAIRIACEKLQSYSLDGCRIFTTVEPDIMSLGAIYWARLGELNIGLRKEELAEIGYGDTLMQFNEFYLPEEKRVLPVERNCMPNACEEVFKYWSKLNGTIY